MSAIIALALAGGIGIAVYARSRGPVPMVPPPASQPATRAIAPATVPVQPPAPLTKYIDWVRQMTPLTDAKLEESRLARADAAHLRFSGLVYVCSRGDLWLTHPEAPTIEDVLRQASKVSEHLTRDRVVYVFWDIDNRGARRATVVVRRGPDKLVLVRPDGATRQLDGSIGDWDRARTLDDVAVIPAKNSLALLTPWPEIKLETVSLGNAGDEPVQLVPTSESLIAFIPQHSAGATPAKVLRLSDGHWSVISESADWKGPFIHLIPRADGSVLQIRPGTEDGTVRLSAALLEKGDVPREQVAAAVQQLSADSPAARENAEQELIALGPGIWPVLEELLAKQPPEATFRIHDILAARNEPRLGNMRLVGDRLKVIERFADGVVFFADGGVQIARPDGQLAARSDAWIVARDSGAVIRLPDELSRCLLVGQTSVSGLDDDWIVADSLHGCRLFMGKDFVPLTGKDENAYTKLVGRDRQGRLLFQRPRRDQYLLIDPWLADPTPRLPIWQITVEGGEAGWDQDDWPAMKKRQAWSLHAEAWQPLKEASARFSNSSPPTTNTDLLATLPNGTLISGGRTDVIFRRPGVEDFTLDLPAGQQATVPVAVAAAVGDGPLFLFNSPGRIIRIGHRPGAREWKIEGAFDKGMPRMVTPTRLWVDPAGRLCLAWDGNGLAIMFPNGRIPPAILDLMPQDQVKIARER
jgi:hypothetical protein